MPETAYDLRHLKRQDRRIDASCLFGKMSLAEINEYVVDLLRDNNELLAYLIQSETIIQQFDAVAFGRCDDV